METTRIAFCRRNMVTFAEKRRGKNRIYADTAFFCEGKKNRMNIEGSGSF
jgi:hypothetical protein